jgi:phosphatidate cytidylyltransferase
MHSKRILTALAAGPLLLGIILWGGSGLFNLLILLVAAACLYEYYHAVFPGNRPVAAAGIVSGLLSVLSVIIWDSTCQVALVFYAVFLLSIILFLITYSSWKNCLESWAMFTLGALYIGTCALHLVLIRAFDQGVSWILFLTVVIFCGDSGAYYLGKALGKTKLCPSISSGKTVAGAVGGIFLNVLSGLLMWFIVLRDIDPRFIVPLVILLGLVGQMGDLAESVIKRAAGVKDSGAVLPGHGGIFDRVDALLLAAPMLYWILLLVAHMHLFGITERLIYYAT